MSKPARFPYISRSNIVDHCRAWAKEIRTKQLNYTNLNRVTVVILIDEMIYPIRAQDWISHPDNGDLQELIEATNRVLLDHTNEAKWKQVFVIIDSLAIVNKQETSFDLEEFLSIQPTQKVDIKNSKSKLHRFAREEMVKHCKDWAENARFEYLELATGDKSNAQHSTDRLTHPMSIQHWIDWHNEPELSEIVQITEEIEQNHTNPAKWERLIKLIDSL